MQMTDYELTQKTRYMQNVLFKTGKLPICIHKIRTSISH